MTSGRLSAHAKDTYIAPAVSKFVRAAIPDMSHLRSQSSRWIPTYILNVVLRAEVPSPEREYRLNFLRRAVIAETEYHLARASTLAFLDSSGTVFRHYFEAIHHWEQFLAASWLALDTLRKWTGQKIFQKNDGSPEQRVNALYDQMKHADSRIENASLGQMPSQGPLPVWLTNDGLQGTECGVSWTEARDTLKLLADIAHALEDPLATETPLANLRAASQRTSGTAQRTP